MTEWSARWQKLLTDLETERDELRVKLHLAKADARDEMAKLDERLDDVKAKAKVELEALDTKIDALKAKAKAFDKDGDGIMDDIGDAARDLAGEIRQGFQRVRNMF